MRRALVLTSLASLLAAIPVSAQAPAGGAAARSAADLYKANCQMCHMPNGDSALKPMNFADGEWIHGSDVKSVVKVIAEGVPKTAMMPFKGRFSEPEIEALARYVRAFDKKLKDAKAGTK